MNCPSCSFHSSAQAGHCIRCGFSLKKFASQLLALRGTSLWILRRSLAGFATGFVGWCVIPAASRAAGGAMSQTAHLLFTGFLGGLFLGAVEGMVEESTLKTLKGASSGAVGGFLGGGLGAMVIAHRGPNAGMEAVVVTWALAGLSVGLVSAWMEVRLERLIAGAVAGALGGAVGGWLGYQMYMSILDITKVDFWWLKRLIEGATGAVLGAFLWCVIGVAERVFIFKRRTARGKDHKTCDACRQTNPLNAWYCVECGSVLQEAAAPERLELPRYEALERVTSGLRFLGRLTAMASAVVAVLAGCFLGGINLFVGFFGFLATCLAGYLGYVLFHALADWLDSSAS